jgi:hypothetical protein
VPNAPLGRDQFPRQCQFMAVPIQAYVGHIIYPNADRPSCAAAYSATDQPRRSREATARALQVQPRQLRPMGMTRGRPACSRRRLEHGRRAFELVCRKPNLLTSTLASRRQTHSLTGSQESCSGVASRRYPGPRTRTRLFLTINSHIREQRLPSCLAIASRPTLRRMISYSRVICSARCSAPPSPVMSAASPHSMTSSARATIDAGTIGPIRLAVLRLMANSYFVGACTDR